MSPSIDWTPVEEAEREKTVTGYKLAILEAAKILEERLTEEKVPGSSFAQKIDSARLHFTRPEDVIRAGAYVEGLRHGVTGGLTKERGKVYVQTLRQAVADINELSQARDSFAAQAKLYLGLLKGKQRWLLRILIGVGAFFLTVLFLADTWPGRTLVDGVVDLVHAFFGLIITLLISLAVVIVVILATAIYLGKNRTGRVRGEDEE